MPNAPVTSIKTGAPATILSSASQPAIRSIAKKDHTEPGGAGSRPHAAFAAAFAADRARSRPPSPAPSRDNAKGAAPVPAQASAGRKSTFFSGAQEKSCFFDPRRAIGMQLGDACQILEVTAAGQAAEHGVRPGWVVTTANFNAVSSPERFNEEICLAKEKALSSITIGFVTAAGTSPAKRIAKAREFAASATPGGGAAPGGVEARRRSSLAREMQDAKNRRRVYLHAKGVEDAEAEAELDGPTLEQIKAAPAGRDADARADDDEDDDDDVAAVAARTGRAAAGAAPPAGSPSVLDRRLSVTHVGAQAAAWTLAPDFERVNLAPECAGHGAKPVGVAVAVPRRSQPPFDPKLVGALSAHGQKARAKPKPNQDRALVAYPVPGPPGKHRALFVVADGHGRRGDACSEFVTRSIVAHLDEHLEDTPDDAVADVLGAAVREAHARIKAQRRFDSKRSGTTCCATLLVGRELHCANVGDSRAVVARRRAPAGGVPTFEAIALSRDHKPEDPAEAARVTAANGFCGRPAGALICRVYLDPDLTYPGLAMTRSIGDTEMDEFGVTATPEMSSHTLSDEDAFFAVASDGLWEFMDSQQVVDLIAHWLDHFDGDERMAECACHEMIKEAMQRWAVEVDDGYCDDISLVIVRLPCWGLEPEALALPPLVT